MAYMDPSDPASKPVDDSEAAARRAPELEQTIAELRQRERHADLRAEAARAEVSYLCEQIERLLQDRSRREELESFTQALQQSIADQTKLIDERDIYIKTLETKLNEANEKLGVSEHALNESQGALAHREQALQHAQAALEDAEQALARQTDELALARRPLKNLLVRIIQPQRFSAQRPSNGDA